MVRSDPSGWLSWSGLPNERRPLGSSGKETSPVQGVIKSYDPATRDGVVMSERDFTEYDLAADAHFQEQVGKGDFHFVVAHGR